MKHKLVIFLILFIQIPVFLGGVSAKPSDLYGSLSLYGEYDVGNALESKSFYGSPNDANLEPAKVSVPTAKIINKKNIIQVKPKQIKKIKKSGAILKPVALLDAKEKIAPVEKPIKTNPEKVYFVQAPNDDAKKIVGNLGNINPDSFCTAMNPSVLGPLPKGIVLMPGRPDLMNCVVK